PARVRAREARTAGVADNPDGVPAGDRARAQGPPDRAARAGSHGVLRAAAEGVREVQGGLRARRHAPRPGAEEVLRVGEAPREVRDEARAGRRVTRGARSARRGARAAACRGRGVVTRAPAAAL